MLFIIESVEETGIRADVKKLCVGQEKPFKPSLAPADSVISTGVEPQLPKFFQDDEQARNSDTGGNCLTIWLSECVLKLHVVIRARWLGCIDGMISRRREPKHSEGFVRPILQARDNISPQ